MTTTPKVTVVLGGRKTYMHGLMYREGNVGAQFAIDLTRSPVALLPPGEHNLPADTVMPGEPDVRIEIEDAVALETLRELCDAMLKRHAMRVHLWALERTIVDATDKDG